MIKTSREKIKRYKTLIKQSLKRFNQLIFTPYKFFFILFLVVFISLNLQLTFLQYFKISNVGPDLFFILTIFFALNLRKKAALVLGFILGALKDTFSAVVFGINTVLFVGWVLLIQWVIRLIYKEEIEILLLVSIIIIGTIFNSLMMRFWLLAHGIPISQKIFFTRIILEVIYNSLSLLILARFLKRCVLKYYR